MYFSARILVSALSIYRQVSLAAATSAGVSCPTVGPTPPPQCDGRDGVWFPVSVIGSDTFCAIGPEVCVADQFAACPGPTKKLPYGSKCVQLDSEVYACIPKTSCDDGVFGASQNASSSTNSDCESGCSIDSSVPQQCNGSSGWNPVSVVGSGTFCVKGAVCTANTQDACPGPQRGLPFGSSCVRIPSGVFGCVKNTKCQKACSLAATHDLCDTATDVPVVSPTPTPAPTTRSPVPTTGPPTTSNAAPTPGPTVSPTTPPPTAQTVCPTPLTTVPPSTTGPATTAPTQGGNTGTQTPGPNLVDTFTTRGFETAPAPPSSTSDSGDIPMLVQSHGSRQLLVTTNDAEVSQNRTN